ncbi:MAG: acetate kinase AckA [Bacteroidetes bacterium HLUCCA01]|nr:MAG: acetate kinase AckA [Bacteroidetes bacterium HLUCCA01]
MITLVINCGSSSVKYQLINTEDRTKLASGVVERIGAVTAIVKHELPGAKPAKKTMQIDNHTIALKEIMEHLLSPENGVVESVDQIKAVGHRVVHGGETFKDSVLIDDSVIEAIEQAYDLAPLHNPPNMKGIEAAREYLPDAAHVAVFDTAFHHSLPPEAYLYAIPNRMYRRYKIRKYGFHGTSHYYVSRKYYEITKRKAQGTNVITCHLGNGCSITAIKDGKSIDTSMGFTPLAGLVMGTRSGDIDPSIMFYLIEKEEMSLNHLHAMLNRNSGLLGLSGYAADMRDLITEAENGDRRCEQAIDVYTYRTRQYIGSYMAALNGCDAIIFTAGVGENAPFIRSKICSGLQYLGVELDEEKNQNVPSGRKEHKISTDESRIEVYVISTDEEMVIAIDAAKIATAAMQSPWV